MSPLHTVRNHRYVTVVFLFIFAAIAAAFAMRESHRLLDREERASCRPGPWGELRYLPMWIELPNENAKRILSTIGPTRWFVVGENKEDILQAIGACGIGAFDLEWLRTRAAWEAASNGYWIFPGEELPWRLSAETRQKLYSKLAQSPENGFHATPFLFRPEWLAERLERSKLPDAIAERFQSALYSRGRLQLFSDLPAMLSTILEEEQKLKFIKMLSAKPTMLLKVRVDESSPLESLADYWGQFPRRKDVSALLQSMAAVPGGCRIDVAHLLPSFARTKIYTYPVNKENSSKPNENCHWTSFNFFADEPDDRFLDPHYMQDVIDREYDVVTGERRLGDVVLLLDAQDRIIHSAVHIADDIVFTKLGGAETQPWIYMKLDDMLPYYSGFGSELPKVVVCRRIATAAARL